MSATAHERIAEREPGVERRRLHQGELISAAGALALLVLMFAAAWYGADGVPGHGTSRQVASTENAWHALSLVRWVMLLAIAVAFGAALLHLSQRTHGVQTDTGLLVTVIGGLSATLLIYRVLIDLPAPDEVVDQKLGAFLGVLSALAITYGGYESLRYERAQSRMARQRASAAQEASSG